MNKENTYLYLDAEKELEELPQQLYQVLGKVEFVMELDLSSRDKLAQEDIQQVRGNILQQGFHLQLPPNPQWIRT